MNQTSYLTEQQQFLDAIKLYDEVITHDPSNEKTWHEKGKLLNMQAMCDQAVDHFINYTMKFPDSNRAIEGLDIAMECKNNE